MPISIFFRITSVKKVKFIPLFTTFQSKIRKKSTICLGK